MEREQTTEVLSEIDREKKEAARIKNGNRKRRIERSEEEEILRVMGESGGRGE